MTRSHKANDPVHGVEPQTGAQDSVPRNFGKHAGHTDPPNKAKKNGGGKANWGRDGDEILDSEEFTMHRARRRSNSKGHLEDMYTKFEEHEEEPSDEMVVKRVDTASSTSSDASSSLDAAIDKA